MANHRSDPTASSAIGNIDREIRIMRKQAHDAARLLRSGKLTPEQEYRLRRRFTGIFSRFLREALEEST